MSGSLQLPPGLGPDACRQKRSRKSSVETTASGSTPITAAPSSTPTILRPGAVGASRHAPGDPSQRPPRTDAEAARAFARATGSGPVGWQESLAAAASQAGSARVSGSRDPRRVTFRARLDTTDRSQPTPTALPEEPALLRSSTYAPQSNAEEQSR
eukprot:14888641-Alexandrium_andersonii.AAC.1